MNSRLLRVLIALLMGVTQLISPTFASIAEISHNFTDYVHLEGVAGEDEIGPTAVFDSLDALIQEFLTDKGASQYFLTLEEEDGDDLDEEAAFWTDKKFLIAGGLLLSTGLVLGILAILMGNGGESQAGEVAGGGAGPSGSSSPSSSPDTSPDSGQPLSSEPLMASTDGPTENTDPSSNDDPNLLGGGGPGGGEPGDQLLNEISEFPEGNPNQNLATFPLSSEEEQGSGGSGSRKIPHSPEPSTVLLSLMGLTLSLMRRRKRS